MYTNSDSYLNVLGQINLDAMNIQQVFGYYQQSYLVNVKAQEFVRDTCKIDDEFKGDLHIGYCDRTMGKKIPKKRNAEGGASPQGPVRRASCPRV